jgi:hypothetical protein
MPVVIDSFGWLRSALHEDEAPLCYAPTPPFGQMQQCPPGEVVTDRAATYPMVLEELLPAAWHRTDQYANNRVEADHGR